MGMLVRGAAVALALMVAGCASMNAVQRQVSTDEFVRQKVEAAVQRNGG